MGAGASSKPKEVECDGNAGAGDIDFANQIDGDFTIEVEVFMEEPGDTYRPIISRYKTPHNVFAQFNLQVQQGGNINFFMGNGDSAISDGYGLLLNGGNLEPATWTAIKVTSVDGTFTMFVNGEEKESKGFDGDRTANCCDCPVRVGAYDNTDMGGGPQYFKGKKRKLRMYGPDFDLLGNGPNAVAAGAAPTQPVFITWKKWETTVQIGEEKLDDGFGSFDEGPRGFYAFADEQPGTKEFSIGDVKFFAYTEEQPDTVQHTICSAFMKWWVGPVGMDKGGREESGDGWELTDTFWAPQVARPTQPVFITWKEWETTVQIGEEKLDDGFGSFDEGPRMFYTFADEQPGTKEFSIGDVKFFAYTEEKPGMVQHTICSAFMKWWVGPVGMDKGGREESGDGWELTDTFWAPPGDSPAPAPQEAMTSIVGNIQMNGIDQYLHLAYGATDNATNVEIYEKGTEWKIEQVPPTTDYDPGTDNDSSYTIEASGSGKFVHLSYGKTDNATNIELYEKPSHWRFVQCEESSDTYLIESAYEGGKGKYLHTAYSKESNGTNVELYEVGSKWCIPGFKPA